MPQSRFHRPVALVVTGAFLVITFLAILIGAGHGAGPVVYLLLSGSPEVWLWPQFFGWIGILLEILAAFSVSKKRWKVLAIGGLVALFISALLFVVTSETLSYLTLFVWFMLPFSVMFILRTLQVLKKKNEDT